jgi:hypothetical protein
LVFALCRRVWKTRLDKPISCFDKKALLRWIPPRVVPVGVSVGVKLRGARDVVGSRKHPALLTFEEVLPKQPEDGDAH